MRPGWTGEAATLKAAVAARCSWAPATAPVAWVGPALSDLLGAPEAIEALRWLERLAPHRPVGKSVTVEEDRLRKAMAGPEGGRLPEVLRALAPAASERRPLSFQLGARLEYR